MPIIPHTITIYTTFIPNRQAATNAPTIIISDTASYSFTIGIPISNVTDAITAPTPACIPSRS